MAVASLLQYINSANSIGTLLICYPDPYYNGDEVVVTKRDINAGDILDGES